ncbi:MAG: hypothetical protein WDZ52_02895 [Pseudohongiellaceae bacterium]
MPLFRDRVALEACPAKTAEAVSYGATFAVLAWILATNYTGLGFANEQAVLAANTNDSASSAERAPISAKPMVYNSAEKRRESADSEVTQARPELAVEYSELLSTAQPEFVAWPANLELQRQLQNHSRLQLLGAIQATTQLQQEQILPPKHINDDLALPLPFIQSNDRSESSAGSELAAERVADDSPLLHAITVTGPKTERLRTRPDNIDRPQIPRAFRAQDIQRSLLLPPRIQALKP